MLDKTPKDQASAYIGTLVRCINLVRAQNAVPSLLIHDAIEDRCLVPKIQEHLQFHIEVIEEPDPLELKNRISRCSLLIGSRFHALIGALSQSIPAIGFGWSHKYERLFEDFDCVDLAMPVHATNEELKETISQLLSPESSRSVGKRLNRSATRQLAQTEAMWDKIEQRIAIN